MGFLRFARCHGVPQIPKESPTTASYRPKGRYGAKTAAPAAGCGQQGTPGIGLAAEVQQQHGQAAGR